MSRVLPCGPDECCVVPFASEKEWQFELHGGTQTNKGQKKSQNGPTSTQFLGIINLILDNKK